MAVLLLLTALLFAGAGILSGFSDIQKVFAQLPLSIYVIFVGSFALNTLCRGARWPLAAARLNIAVPTRRMWLFYVSGFALAATPGKLGTAIRLWFLKEKNGTPYQKSTPLYILDQATDLLAILALTLWGLIALTSTKGHFTTQIITISAILIASTTLLMWPTALRKSIKLFYVLTGRRARKKFGKVLAVSRRLHTLFNSKFLSFMLLFASLGWLAEIYALHAVTHALGHPISLQLAAGIFGLTILLSIFSFLPGGIGVAEISLTTLLTLTGMPLSAAIVVTALVRFFTLWLAVLIGLAALPFAFKTKPA